MIDCENEIFNEIAIAARTEFPTLTMTGEYIKTPSSFPFCSLVEMDNYAYEETRTSSNVENHSVVMYELDVYSNKKVGKKSECKAIARFIDERLALLGFTRVMLQPIPNMDDATIYRLKGRYRAVISKDKKIYWR